MVAWWWALSAEYWVTGLPRGKHTFRYPHIGDPSQGSVWPGQTCHRMEELAPNVQLGPLDSLVDTVV